MNALVLGGNRFIGAELVTQLLVAGHRVSVIALDPPPSELLQLVDFTALDRNDPDALTSYFATRRFDVVFDNIAFRPEHVAGLLQAMGDRGGRYVLTSSVDIYPVVVPQQWREDDGPLEPSELEGAPEAEHYLRGKRACEKLVRQSGLPFSIVRPAMVTGARDPIPPRPRHWSQANPLMVRSLHLPCRVLDGGPILLPQHDRRVFQLAWVQDVAAALILAGTHAQAVGRCFNVAGDELWTHERLVKALAQVAGQTSEVVRVSASELLAAGLAGMEPPYGLSVRCSLANTEALQSLGWHPTPCHHWLAQLLEAAADTRRRPFYHLRAREVALGSTLLDGQSVPRPDTRINLNSVAASAYPVSARGQNISLFHGRDFDGRMLSTIGIGTHRGDADDATDAAYAQALHAALDGGINIVDTAINYRAMRSERVVGTVLRARLATGAARESMFVVSKGGFVPHDAQDPRSAKNWINDELVQTGLLDADDALVRHSIRARWITNSLARSLVNLGLDHIDGYLLHNPERAMVRLGHRFWTELTRTFAALEDAVSAQHIGCYGLALWDTLPAAPDSASHLSLERALYCAHVAAGGGVHHLRLLELPLNVTAAAAARTRNQMHQGRLATALTVAQAHNLFVLTSASVARGGALSERYRARLPQQPTLDTEHAQALQFTRSVPGVGSALIGMKRVEHVHQALAVMALPPLEPEEINRLVALG